MTLRDLTYEQRQARDAYRKQERELKRASSNKAEREAKVTGLAVDEVVIPPRPKISLAQKTRVHAAHEGRCHVCGAEVPISGPEVQYDHVTERTLTGRDDDDALAPICTVPCHAQKSAARMTELAKVNRLRKRRLGEEKKAGRKIPSRPFPDDYCPMPQTRGFRS